MNKKRGGDGHPMRDQSHDKESRSARSLVSPSIGAIDRDLDRLEPRDAVLDEVDDLCQLLVGQPAMNAALSDVLDVCDTERIPDVIVFHGNWLGNVDKKRGGGGRPLSDQSHQNRKVMLRD